jgi:hypothetical protein
MSRISALWTAGAVALLFALIVGAVLLRPVLSVNAGVSGANSQSTTSTLSQDSPLSTDGSQTGLGDNNNGNSGARNGATVSNSVTDDHEDDHGDGD